MAAHKERRERRRTRRLVDIHINVDAVLCSAAMDQLIPQDVQETSENFGRGDVQLQRSPGDDPGTGTGSGDRKWRQEVARRRSLSEKAGERRQRGRGQRVVGGAWTQIRVRTSFPNMHFTSEQQRRGDVRSPPWPRSPETPLPLNAAAAGKSRRKWGGRGQRSEVTGVRGFDHNNPDGSRDEGRAPP